MADNVKVAVRVRPFNQREKDLKCYNIIKMNGPTTVIEQPESSAWRQPAHCSVQRATSRRVPSQPLRAVATLLFGCRSHLGWHWRCERCGSAPLISVRRRLHCPLSAQRRSRSTLSTSATTRSCRAMTRRTRRRRLCGRTLVWACLPTHTMVRQRVCVGVGVVGCHLRSCCA